MSLIHRVAASLWATLAVVTVVSAVAVAVAVQGFGLRISGGIGLYFVIWWTGLFAVLPFGVRSQAEAGDVVSGSEPGAPAMPALREKALWTTLLAAVVLIAAAWLMPLSGL
jgi:predicted secreted protein